MDNWGVWRTIKIGFWLGVGFIVPQLVTMYAGTFMTMLGMPSMMDYSFSVDAGSDELDMSSFVAGRDLSSNIEIKNYKDTGGEGQLLVVGQIVNEGDRTANTIVLEAELFDANGTFVYECSEYINTPLKPESGENFQIKCGCGSSPIPDYKTLKVRVASASSY
ncbi:MAG: FxLYD domain-containing protein [Chromatiales bacterium]|nr:FxLYD domain-containing protein [Chromatiales bacterium]